MFIEKSEDVWGENYPRLRKIKVRSSFHGFWVMEDDKRLMPVLQAKYDPTGVFNRYFPIEPDFEKSHL